jgi:hypothetical protein
LEALLTKSKAGPKLPPTEALELKELKLLKSAAETAKGRAEIAVAKRKIKDREKYRIGGLAVTAGLSTWTDENPKALFASAMASGPKSSAENGGNVGAEIPTATEHAGVDERLR